ncbi:flagellar biosynthesis anti-sigma factor FlgM [Paenibacillus sp. P26]|nr:flagellar biosynthesis anti-sigma factor FlgM [Paenibacillus sp. P26]UUZ91221.1 flagellar biosynthesis anti-sigma factor FlgM [Paenibacillus sp. P25]
MKINGTNRVGAVNQYKKNQDSQYTASAGRAGKKKDQVEISSEAKELLGTQNVTPPEKLESLKKSVAAGTYQVDAKTLAEKIFPFLK